MRVACAEEAPAIEPPSREGVKFFESHIRPLLARRCFKCHGEDKQKGALRVDGLNTLLAGGESGPAIVAGKPDESLLIEAIRYESYEMPPDGQLPDEEIALLTKWVEIGAPWPEADRDVALPTTGQITEEDRSHWAFQPLHSVEPPDVHDCQWSASPIDRFLWRALIEAELQPSPPADRLTLVRRLYQDLTGLPPTPEQIDAFLSDQSDDAYARLVDELLDSPRYGEHWATFWLDLVRYADSDGYKADHFRQHAWRYRDYVINSLNDDKPYDLFVMEQIAGDEMAPDDPQALAATGYLRNGIYEYNQRDAFTQWQDILNDITDTTGDVFLAMGMGCARCHDHKFDPILQKDYFRLQAFFSGVAFKDDVPIATPQQVANYQRQLTEWEAETAEIREQIDALEKPKLERIAHDIIVTFPPESESIMDIPLDERTPRQQQIADLIQLQVLDKQKALPTKFKGEEKEQWESLKKQLAAFDGMKPKPLPKGRTASDVAETAAVVHIPGKERLGEIAPGFLSILDDSEADYSPLPTSPHTTGRRTSLARWIASPDNPLTSRVIVNRIWQQHFGTGLVATPSDFGRLGEEPSHPELLDWLAVNFIENGWSLKWLHRKIVNSQAYRQASVVEPTQKALMVDPGNRLLWRQNIRRMRAEQIRDAVLSVSGQLKHSIGGPPEDADRSKRRTVYTKIFRNTRDPLLDVFDLPDRIRGNGSRNVTTTPAQSLLMINSDRLLTSANAFAKRLDQELPDGGDSLVRLAYRLAYGRDPSEEELALTVPMLDSAPRPTELTPSSLTTVEMPQSGSRAVVIDPDEETSLLAAVSDQPLPEGDFTIEAKVLLNSLYPDATVRTIVSQWDGNSRHPGWSLGVTSTKSKHQPRNLILQLVGKISAGYEKYEVIASGIHLDLNQPYDIAVTVDLDDTTDSGVTFHVRSLGVPEAVTQSSSVKHHVTRAYANGRAMVIGGRDGTSRHRWDGLIGEVRISDGAVPSSQLLTNSDAKPKGVLGWWTFDGNEPLADQSGSGLPLRQGLQGSRVSPQLVDLCHVLLNSNEFLYVD